MFEYIDGDIFDSAAQELVNPVNCVGVMGKGLALHFKQRYPMNYTFYEQACKQGLVRPGHMLVFELERPAPHQVPQYIINFPTKRHWRDASLLEDIYQGLDALALNSSGVASSTWRCNRLDVVWEGWRGLRSSR